MDTPRSCRGQAVCCTHSCVDQPPSDGGFVPLSARSSHRCRRRIRSPHRRAATDAAPRVVPGLQALLDRHASDQETDARVKPPSTGDMLPKRPMSSAPARYAQSMFWRPSPLVAAVTRGGDHALLRNPAGLRDTTPCIPEATDRHLALRGVDVTATRLAKAVWQARILSAFAPRSIYRHTEDRDCRGKEGERRDSNPRPPGSYSAAMFSTTCLSRSRRRRPGRRAR